MSVNHQPPTEQPVSVDVVAMLERLTIGGGTASGEIIHGWMQCDPICVVSCHLLVSDILLHFKFSISDVADSFHGCVKNIKVNNRFLLATDMRLQGSVLPNSCPN